MLRSLSRASSRFVTTQSAGHLEALYQGLPRTGVPWGENYHGAHVHEVPHVSVRETSEGAPRGRDEYQKHERPAPASLAAQAVQDRASATTRVASVPTNDAFFGHPNGVEELAAELCDEVDVQTEVVRRKYPEYPPFVRELVREVRDLLRKRGEPVAMKRFHAFLTKMPEDNPTRFQAFEAGIRMFLRARCPMAAITCYTRMTAEGFICSISLRAQMSVISMASRSPARDEFFGLLEGWFQNPRFDERAFQDMLFLLDDTISEDPAFIDSVARLYLRCKQPGYSFTRETISWLVYTHARAGSKSFALEWLDPARHAGAGTPDPYTSLLRFVSGSREDDELYRQIVERMQALEIAPDLPFYNALMSAEFARKRYDNAFRIYALLKRSTDPATLPDKLSFGMLFRAHRAMSQPRSFLTRGIGRPRRAPPPRQLYQDMLRSHLARTAHGLAGVLAGASLIPALRDFVARRDYAAAFVVLKTLRQCAVPTDLAMYQRVLAPLMRRLQLGLPLLAAERDARAIWTHRFLGLESAPTGGRRPAYDTRILDMVLRVGMVARLSLAYVAPRLDLAPDPPPEDALSGFDAPAGSSRLYDDLSNRPDGRATHDVEASLEDFRTHDMPSTLEVAGIVESDPHKVYSSVPLERILRRAILADRPRSVLAPMKEVNVELAAAKAQMLGDLKFELSGYSTRKRKPRYVSFSNVQNPAKAAKASATEGRD